MKTPRPPRPIPWDQLPEELQYIRPVAEKHVGRWWSSSISWDALPTPSEIAEAAELYTQIAARGDGPRFYRWHAARFQQGDRIQCEKALASAVHDVFALFHLLGRKNVSPFNSGEVLYEDDAPPPIDWSKLPEPLAYLIPAAERYGEIQFDDQIDDFAARATPDQRAELTALAAKIIQRGDYPAIIEWLKVYKSTKHPEASRIVWVINLFQTLGINY